VSAINNTAKIYGAVYENNKLLSNVYWENTPGVKTYGNFCFPLIAQLYVQLIPYKPGYRFSPDIIHQSGSNSGDMKIFNGLRYEPNYGLNDFFTFDKKIKNRQKNVDDEFIVNGVDFTTDRKLGGVAYFTDKAYVDAGLQSKESLKSNFTITAWIKPTKFSDNNSILGKGKNFVFKIYEGYLTYTMQGIKDYISKKSSIPLNRWTHVAIIHSRFNNRIYFYLNGELTDQIDLVADYIGSDYTLIIGSNLWEEFFIGFLGGIKIWERELNEVEVRNEFNASQKPINSFSFIWFFILFIPLFLLYILRKRKIKHSISELLIEDGEKPMVINGIPASIPKSTETKILCLGGLQIIGGDGKDISKKLSPKLKQLFVLIFINSFGQGKGISSKKLTEILWPGSSPSNAKNMRGTYIQNLRTILSAQHGIEIVFRDKLWFINLAENSYNEYTDIHQQLQKLETRSANNTKTELQKFIGILKRGKLFPNMEQTWLDSFIEKFSNRVVELSIALFHNLDNIKDAVLLYELSEVVSLYDNLNEPALRKKIQVLTLQGKFSLARSVYDSFSKLYQELYDEKFPTDFKKMTLEPERRYKITQAPN
jgi:DNA-binding SARP family transcriptional activator